MSLKEELMAGLSKSAMVTFSISYHAAADSAFGIGKGWNVQRTKLTGVGYCKARVFKTRLNAETWIAAECERISAANGYGCLGVVKEH